MLSLILACVLSGPCEGGKCSVAILPRLRVADSVVERKRTVTKEVKVTAEVAAPAVVRVHRHPLARRIVRVVR